MQKVTEKNEKYNQGDDHSGRIVLLAVFFGWHTFCAELPFDRLHHRRHTVDDPLIEIAFFERRDNDIMDDPAGDKVSQFPLQAVSDLDAQLFFLFGDQEDGPAVVLFGMISGEVKAWQN